MVRMKEPRLEALCCVLRLSILAVQQGRLLLLAAQLFTVDLTGFHSVRRHHQHTKVIGGDFSYLLHNLCLRSKQDHECVREVRVRLPRESWARIRVLGQACISDSMRAIRVAHDVQKDQQSTI